MQYLSSISPFRRITHEELLVHNSQQYMLEEQRKRMKTTSYDHLEQLFKLAKNIEQNPTYYNHQAHSKILTLMFAEPSTRTQFSFHAAMLKLGGQVMTVDLRTSSMQKGETIDDTVQTLRSYSDIIVMRHPDAKRFSEKYHNVFNAGNGSDEHPTQALIDVYTMKYNATQHIILCGDLRYSRTIHSLVKLLSQCVPYEEISLVSPDNLQLPDEYKNMLKNVREYTRLSAYLMKRADVLYMTREQKERHPAFTYYSFEECHLTKELLSVSKPSLCILHPFPRGNELSSEFDHDPRSQYFTQMKNGLWVRMAILLNYFVPVEPLLLPVDKYSTSELSESESEYDTDTGQ